MKDRQEELYKLLARAGHRRAEAEATRDSINAAMTNAFDGNQANVEIVRRKAQGGDEAAEAAYQALLRGREMIG
jgi:hypothetical protein